MTTRHKHMAGVALAIATAVAWGMITAGLLKADPAVVWDRTYLQRDSLTVPVRWTASCDNLGCPDRYRVTWTWGTAETVRPIAPANGGTTNNTRAVAAPVLREVTITTTRDSLRVPVPAIGQPQTVCVSIVALRRGLASDARRGCRTIEAPDAPPPAVDSIRWDTLGVVANLEHVAPQLRDSTVRLEWSGYQYRFDRTDSLRPVLLDSAPLTVENHDGELYAWIRREWTTILCPTVVDTGGVVWGIVPNWPVAITPADVRQYQRRCGNTHRMVASGRPPRWVRAAPLTDASRRATGLRAGFELQTMEGVPVGTDL